MDNFGYRYLKESILAQELEVLKFPLPMLPFVMWLIICSGLWFHHKANKGNRNLLNANYVLLLFFFFRCGLKCRRKQEIVKNVICTSCTDFGEKLLKAAPILPCQKYILFYCLMLFFFNFLLLLTAWNSASWKWIYNDMYLFWNNIYCLWKD